jgi:hypothetical protein
LVYCSAAGGFIPRLNPTDLKINRGRGGVAVFIKIFPRLHPIHTKFPRAAVIAQYFFIGLISAKSRCYAGLLLWAD